MPQQSRAPTPPPLPAQLYSTCVLRATPTLGNCVLGRWDRGQLLIYVVLNVTHFSRHLAELAVTQEVMSGNHQKANEQGPTERCTVCHTVYPQCDTCSRYGRRGVHSLDQDKVRNAHDNPGFTDDSGTQQSHWRKKMERVSAHQTSYLQIRLKLGACCSSVLFCSPSSDLTPLCTWGLYPTMQETPSTMRLAR